MFACKCTCLTNSSQSCSTSCLAQAVGITSECGAYRTYLAFLAFRLKIAGGLHCIWQWCSKDIHTCTVRICAMMSWLFRGLIIFCPLSVIYYMVHRLASVYLFSYSFLKIWKTLIWDWIVLQYEAFLLLLDAIFLFFYMCFIFDVGPKTKKLLVSKSSGKHTFCIWGQNWSKGKVSKPAQRKKPNCLMCETAWCKETILIPLVHWQWDCSIFFHFSTGAVGSWDQAEVRRPAQTLGWQQKPNDQNAWDWDKPFNLCPWPSRMSSSSDRWVWTLYSSLGHLMFVLLPPTGQTCHGRQHVLLGRPRGSNWLILMLLFRRSTLRFFSIVSTLEGCCCILKKDQGSDKGG